MCSSLEQPIELLIELCKIRQDSHALHVAGDDIGSHISVGPCWLVPACNVSAVDAQVSRTPLTSRMPMGT
jgi:hypothetical protein